MEIGNKIQKLRKENGMTQAQFAEEFHVTRQTVSNWENNKNYPDMETMRAISNKYGITFDELLKDDKELLTKIDKTSRKASRLGRALIATGCVILAMIIGFLGFLHMAFMGTPDSKRINTDCDVRAWTELDGAEYSSVITYTLDKSDKDFDKKYEKAKVTVLGRIEGDIPAILIEATDDPKVKVHFQNIDYLDVKPDDVKRVEIEAFDKVREETTLLDLPYEVQDGVLCIDFGKGDYKFNTDAGETWYDCIISIDYTYEGNEYRSVVGIVVMQDSNIDWGFDDEEVED